MLFDVAIQEMFPRVTLRISEDPEQFLRRMNELLLGESDLIVKSKLEFQGDYDHLSVGFSPKNHVIEDLVGMFVYWPDKAPVLMIEALARWEQVFPSYEIYTGAIRDLFASRIKRYNKIHSSRYRLRIPTQEACRPKLTPKLKERFDDFAQLANKMCLHDYDWQRFYEFVVASYKSQRDLSQDDVRYHLRNAGFEATQSEYLADAFNRCKEFYIETSSTRRCAASKRRG